MQDSTPRKSRLSECNSTDLYICIDHASCTSFSLVRYHRVDRVDRFNPAQDLENPQKEKKSRMTLDTLI
jgi:hypothetical protein